MQIRFGYPEHHATHIPLHESYAKFYFKSQINVRTSVLSYPYSSMMAEIGAYLGLLLGFSLMDLTAIIRHFCLSKWFYRDKKICSEF